MNKQEMANEIIRTIGEVLIVGLFIWLALLAINKDGRVPEGYAKLCTILPEDHTLINVANQIEKTGGYQINPYDKGVQNGYYNANINLTDWRKEN